MSVNPGRLFRSALSLRLIRSFGVYTLSSLIRSAIPFLLLPVLTRYLTPYDYGIVAMFQVLTGITATLTGLSVHGAVARQYFERTDLEFPAYVANALFILVGSSLAVGGLFLATSGWIGELAAFPEGWLWSVVLFSSVQFVISVRLVLWQVRSKAGLYGIFQVALTVVNVGLSLALVIGFGMDWRGRILGQVVSYTLFGVLGLALLWSGGWIRTRLDVGYMRNALAFGIPLIPHTLGMWAISMVGRWLVAREVGIAAAGVFVVGVQIGMVMAILQDAFNKAWVPWFYGQLKAGGAERKRRIVKITYLYDLGLLGLAALLSVAAPFMVGVLVGPDFQEAAAIVPWVAFGYAFNGMYKMVTNYAFYIERTQIVALGTVFTGVVNIGVSWWLVQRNGAVGAAQGTTIAFALSFLITWLIVARLYPMPYRIWASTA